MLRAPSRVPLLKNAADVIGQRRHARRGHRSDDKKRKQHAHARAADQPAVGELIGRRGKEVGVCLTPSVLPLWRSENTQEDRRIL